MPDVDMRRVSQSAKDWFDKLMTFYAIKDKDNFENFWWLGNCFDTITDYLLVFNADNPAAAVTTVLEKYYSVRRDHDQSQKVDTWYDDWAWWAIASTKVYDPRYVNVFGSNAAPFADVARTCWTIVDQGLGDGVHLGASSAYVNRENMTKWDPRPQPLPGWYAPLIDGGRGSGLHGTWQYDIFSNRRVRPQWQGPLEGNDESNPSWPFPGYSWAGPFQLTVMNALYFLLAARLEQARSRNPGAPRADTQLKDEFGFLWAWFGKDNDNPLPDGVPGLLKPAGDGMVVLERVSRYASRDGVHDKVYMFGEQSTWGGDIGQVLSALATYNTLYPDTDPHGPVANLIKDLALGYIGRLFGGRAPQPYYPPTGGVFDNDTDDYRSGIGVFMRSLYQAFQQDHSPLWELLKGYDTLRDFLTDCGQWALKQVITPKTDAFDCLNVLATLTAVNAIPH